VAILQDGREPGQQILDGRSHLGHTDDVDNGLQGAENRTQDLGILLTQILVKDHLKRSIVLRKLLQMPSVQLLPECRFEWQKYRYATDTDTLCQFANANLGRRSRNTFPKRNFCCGSRSS
jgi:hypothetical protein